MDQQSEKYDWKTCIHVHHMHTQINYKQVIIPVNKQSHKLEEMQYWITMVAELYRCDGNIWEQIHKNRRKGYIELLRYGPAEHINKILFVLANNKYIEHKIMT